MKSKKGRRSFTLLRGAFFLSLPLLGFVWGHYQSSAPSAPKAPAAVAHTTPALSTAVTEEPQRLASLENPPSAPREIIAKHSLVSDQTTAVTTEKDIKDKIEVRGERPTSEPNPYQGLAESTLLASLPDNEALRAHRADKVRAYLNSTIAGGSAPEPRERPITIYTVQEDQLAAQHEMSGVSAEEFAGDYRRARSDRLSSYLQRNSAQN